jgi:colanic acid biosynthesis glycosyl transferase WcaI
MNYAPEFAGVGRYTGEIGSYLAALGYAVCVITTPPHYPGWTARRGYSAARWAKETLHGAEVYRCPLYLHPKMAGIRRMLAPLSFALTSAPVALWRILRLRPDVVMVVEPSLMAAPIGLFGAWITGAKTVLHVQDLEVEAAFAVGHLAKAGVLERLATMFDRRMTRAFDRVITISQLMAERIAAKGVASSNIAVIRNWVDLEQIQPLDGGSPYRAELGLGDNQFVVLYAGSLGAKQGLQILVEATRALADRPDISVVIAGDGPMRQTLETAAGELANLRLLPFQPEARMCDFLALADLHVLPQERDAADLVLPSKLGGMLASGRRILATAAPGTELANFLGDACVITPPGDAVALAGAILEAASGSDVATDRAQRLACAEALSKRLMIDHFVRAALFLPEGASPRAA